MKIWWVNRRGPIAKIADTKAEAAFVLKDGDLLAPLMGAAQAKVNLEELAGGLDVGHLKINVVEDHGVSPFSRHVLVWFI
jgi:hypothetical protein